MSQCFVFSLKLLDLAERSGNRKSTSRGNLASVGFNPTHQLAERWGFDLPLRKGPARVAPSHILERPG
jgi:hypothetical protein